MAAQVETYQFQAETKQLLDIMIHSLYTTKDIFLRELISNASDALDRLGFESLTKPELTEEDATKEVLLEADAAARTLTISDSGIGMSRDEVIENIGTIAKSGTRDLREKIREGASASVLEELIGQFGVGFYSAFMVADRVTLLTRRAGEQRATRWESTGDGQYTISDADKPTRGTSITLHLKPVDHGSCLSPGHRDQNGVKVIVPFNVIGGSGGLIPVESSNTVFVKLAVPAAVGVPLITPAGDRPSPRGNDPVDSDQPKGGVPPAAVKVPEYLAGQPLFLVSFPSLSRRHPPPTSLPNGRP